MSRCDDRCPGLPEIGNRQWKSCRRFAGDVGCCNPSTSAYDIVFHFLEGG